MTSKNKINSFKNASSNAKDEVCISLVGPIGCGKSALLVKYITRRFIGEYDPCYEGCWTKYENIDGIEVNVQIMDTFDKDRRNLEKYFKWSDALILVYSITNSQSFFQIQEYLEHVQDIVKKIAEDPNEKTEKALTKIILLGNKIDMERYRQVNKQDVENLIEKYSNMNKTIDMNSSLSSDSISLNLIHMETTACEEFELVQNLFHKIIRDVRRERETFQLTNSLQIYEENNNNYANNTNNSQLKNFNSKSRFNTNSTTINNNNNNNKRAKSPKSNSNNLIQDYTSPMAINGGAGQNQNANNANNSNTGLVNFQSNNMSISSYNNLNSMSNLSNKETTKKNSSKFPFFTKILNKS